MGIQYIIEIHNERVWGTQREKESGTVDTQSEIDRERHGVKARQS